MKLTHTITNETINSKSPSKIASRLGVSRQSVWRWNKKGKTQIYNKWIIEF